jgi:hypothetical protein
MRTGIYEKFVKYSTVGARSCDCPYSPGITGRMTQRTGPDRRLAELS